MYLQLSLRFWHRLQTAVFGDQACHCMHAIGTLQVVVQCSKGRCHIEYADPASCLLRVRQTLQPEWSDAHVNNCSAHRQYMVASTAQHREAGKLKVQVQRCACPDCLLEISEEPVVFLSTCRPLQCTQAAQGSRCCTILWSWLGNAFPALCLLQVLGSSNNGPCVFLHTCRPLQGAPAAHGSRWCTFPWSWQAGSAVLPAYWPLPQAASAARPLLRWPFPGSV